MLSTSASAYSVFRDSNISIQGGTFLQQNNPSLAIPGFERLIQATSPDAFHNSAHRFDPPRCYPKTRIKVIEKLTNWINGVDDRHVSVMWVNGGPGVGKSAIAQSLAELLMEQGRILASYFFSRNDPSRNNANHLIASIAYHIALYIPQLKEHIIHAIDNNPLIFNLSLESQFSTLITQPVLNLARSGYFTQADSCPRVIIIDGLDECNDQRAQVHILNTISSALRNSPLPLLFLITSRPEPQLKTAFTSTLMAEFYMSLKLDDFFPDSDIRFYLEEQFKELRNTHPHRAFLPSPWPTSRKIDILVWKSSRQFIYASTVIKYISSPLRRPDRQLDVILGLRAARNENPFTELDALYVHILSSIEADRIQLVLDILAYTILCWKPQDMIEVILQIESGDVHTSLYDLGSIVQVVDNEVRIHHASLGDFLKNASRSGVFFIDPPVRYASYAVRCFQILKSPRMHTSLTSYVDKMMQFLPHYCKQAGTLTSELYQAFLEISFLDTRTILTERYYSRFVKQFRRFMGVLLNFAKDRPDIQLHLYKEFDKYHQVHLANCYTNIPHTFLMALNGLYIRPVPTMFWGADLQREYKRVVPDDYYKSLFGPLDVKSSEVPWPLQHEFANYYGVELTSFLLDTSRCGILALDGKRFATAALHCLRFLCLERTATPWLESSFREKVPRRNSPFFWRKRLRPLLKPSRHFLRNFAWAKRKQFGCPNRLLDGGEGLANIYNQRCHSRVYKFALRCLRQFLKRSAYSAELAEFASHHSFAPLSQDWPRRARMTRKAINRYIAFSEDKDTVA